MFRAEIDQTGYQSISALCSYANIYLWKLTRNYWGVQPEDTLFLHTWSLSLEEQFYIVYPILAVLILKRYKFYFRHACILLCAFGFFFFAYFAEEKPQASFYLLPFRFWELLVGCTVASFQTSYSRPLPVVYRYNNVIAWIGLFLIVVSFFLIDSKHGVGATLVAPTFGSALILFTTIDSCHYVKRILTNSFITFIGRISYSLYLWHWPLLYYLEHFEIDSSLLYALVLLVFSITSYFIIEKPARNHPKSLPIIIGFMFLCIIFSIFIIKSKGRYDTSSFNKTVWSGMSYHYGLDDKMIDSVMLNERFWGIELNTENKKKSTNTTSTASQVYVFGDSHSLMWSETIDEVTTDATIKNVNFYGTDGKFPYVEYYHKKSKDNDYLQLHYGEIFGIKKDSIIIIGALWSFEYQREPALRKLLYNFQELGCRTILMEQPPILYFGDKNAPQYLSYLGYHPTPESKIYIPIHSSDNWDKGRKMLERLVNDFHSCSLVKTSDLLLKNNNALVILNNDVLYIDDDHLSSSGASLFKDRLKETIIENIQLLQSSDK